MCLNIIQATISKTLLLKYYPSNHFLNLSALGCRDTSQTVDLPVYFVHFFSHISKIFINIHEIEDQITLLSDSSVIIYIVIAFI